MKTTAFEFRPNSIDEVVFRHVYQENEYQVPEKLQPEDLIIDIGAHIGSFSYLCWQRGSRNIIALEANPENMALAQRNLAHTNVDVRHHAVWRSDIEQPIVLYNSGHRQMLPGGPDPVGINTGVGNVMAESGLPVTTIGLDQIIDNREVRILKIDCEGSEFPILLTSKQLKNIAFIAGEYHLMENIPPIARMPGIEKYTLGLLADLFTENRFRVEFIPNPHPMFPNVGNFFAYNLDK